MSIRPAHTRRQAWRACEQSPSACAPFCPSCDVGSSSCFTAKTQYRPTLPHTAAPRRCAPQVPGRRVQLHYAGWDRLRQQLRPGYEHYPQRLRVRCRVLVKLGHKLNCDNVYTIPNPLGLSAGLTCWHGLSAGLTCWADVLACTLPAPLGRQLCWLTSHGPRVGYAATLVNMTRASCCVERTMLKHVLTLACVASPQRRETRVPCSPHSSQTAWLTPTCVQSSQVPPGRPRQVSGRQ